jgi:hypothetical protein
MDETTPLEANERFILNTLRTVSTYLNKAEHDLANRNYPGVAYNSLQGKIELEQLRDYMIRAKLV